MKTANLQALQVAALKVDGLRFWRVTTRRAAKLTELRTKLSQQVVDVLTAVYENYPSQPNERDECGRSFGRTTPVRVGTMA